MANSKVTIVVRPRTGNRCPVKATGVNDPLGSYYLRYCEGSKVLYSKPMESFDQAEAAKVTIENKRGIEALGGTAPAPVEPVGPKHHRWLSVLDSYLHYLRTTTKRNGRKYTESSVRMRKSDILAFMKFSGRMYVEQITRADLILYKDSLFRLGRASDTVLNKLMTICSWLRHNQVVSIVGLLKPSDWPLPKKTFANPYRKGEIDAMMKVAGEHKLLLRFFLGTGMRKGEIAHAEKSDLNRLACTISVNSKPHFGWETKTVASVREIPISPALMDDLLARPGNGLLFPNGRSGGPELHLERIIQTVALAAGVKAPAKADWAHRWRDSFATMQVRAKIHDHRDIARMLGHADLATMDLYAEFCRMDSDDARKAAIVSDPYAEKVGPQLVKAG